MTPTSAKPLTIQNVGYITINYSNAVSTERNDKKQKSQTGTVNMNDNGSNTISVESGSQKNDVIL